MRGTARFGPKKRKGTKLTVHGVTKTIHEWSEQTGIALETIRWRLRQGWGEDKVLCDPKRNELRPGMEINFWTVIERADDRITPKLAKVPMMRCRCRCGTVRNIHPSTLRRGLSRSCGRCGASRGAPVGARKLQEAA